MDGDPGPGMNGLQHGRVARRSGDYAPAAICWRTRCDTLVAVSEKEKPHQTTEVPMTDKATINLPEWDGTPRDNGGSMDAALGHSRGDLSGG